MPVNQFATGIPPLVSSVSPENNGLPHDPGDSLPAIPNGIRLLRREFGDRQDWPLFGLYFLPTVTARQWEDRSSASPSALDWMKPELRIV